MIYKNPILTQKEPRVVRDDSRFKRDREAWSPLGFERPRTPVSPVDMFTKRQASGVTAKRVMASQGHNPRVQNQQPVLPKARGRRASAEPLESSGTGRALDEALRRDMENAFEVDFSGVQVFESAAAQSHGFDAWTQGERLHFAPGMYAPNSEKGRTLIGHELTHVVQQREGRVPQRGGVVLEDPSLEREADVRGAMAARGQTFRGSSGRPSGRSVMSAMIQPRRSDFQINGEQETEDGDGMEDYLFFDRGSAELGEAQLARLRQLVEGLDESQRGSFRLRGLASEEGDSASNAQLAQARVDAVARALAGMGIPETAIQRDPAPEASGGQINYRRWRAVQVLTQGAEVGLDCSDGAPGTERPQMSPEQQTMLNNAISQALNWVIQAHGVLSAHQAGSPPPPTVVEFFGQSADVARLTQDVETLRAGVDNQTRNATLVSACENPAGHLAWERNDAIFIDPNIFNEEPLQLARILLHESCHLGSGLDTIDVAYGHSRLCRRMPTEDAYRNADSYTLMITTLAGQNGLPDSTPVEDSMGSLSEADQELARDTLAYLQRWVEEGSLIANHIYGAFGQGLSASPPAWNDNRSRDWMLQVGRSFQVPTNRARPLPENREVIAALNDRYRHMANVFRTPIEVTQATNNTTTWTDHHIQAAPSLWSNPLRTRVRFLLRKLLAITPGVSNEVIGAYVDITQLFSQGRDIGPDPGVDGVARD